MPRFNELLAARFNEGASAVLGLSEQEGIRTVAPELMPCFISEREKPEHAYLKQERLCHGFSARAADAGNFSMVYLSNPAGSNLLVILEKIIAGTTVAAAFSIGPSNNPPAGVAGLNNVRDTRWFAVGGSLNSGARVVNAVSAANQGTVNLRIPAADFRVIEWEYVLSPGFAFVYSSSAINTAIDGVGFQWRERAMLPEEAGA